MFTCLQNVKHAMNPEWTREWSLQGHQSDQLKTSMCAIITIKLWHPEESYNTDTVGGCHGYNSMRQVKLCSRLLASFTDTPGASWLGSGF